MAFLLDTNIVSELQKGRSRCHARVWQWYEATPLEEIFLSVLVLGEIRRGVELKKRRDPASARAFERWLQEVALLHHERVLLVDTEICDLWGRLSPNASLPVIDGLLAATAARHGLTVATRNTKDFQRCGVDYINPFET
jgi:predicted nucleic acid-binding protein